MKQLIEDLISAMEYHVEQTRPIHSTTIALQAAREALKAMPTPLVCDCNQGQVCHVCDPITPPAAQPAPSQYGSPELQEMIVARAIEKDRAAQPAVPLTDDQISAIGSKIFPSTWNPRHVEFARAIEAKLKEMNT